MISQAALNLAVSAAMMKSHIMASSHPPPSAKPATAAMTGLRISRSTSQFLLMRPPEGAHEAVLGRDVPAPAARPRSLPVMTMHPPIALVAA